MEADIVHDALCLAHHVFLTQKGVAGFFLAKEHVGGDGQVTAQHHFLVHGIDPVIDRLLRACQCGRLAFPQDLAAGPTDHTGQKLDQGRFASAVFADDGVDFAVVEGECGWLERFNRPEMLV